MQKTIIKSVVAVLCTVALCLTIGLTSKPAEKADSNAKYVNEHEAAVYLGVTDEVMVMMREKLRYMDGAFMKYTYLDESGEEVTDIVYSKDALDEIMEEHMEETGALNFKFLQKPEGK